jgi:deoxyhypusine monooxygenase
LRESLCSETTPLPIRFRALFSLKHLAKHETGQTSEKAIEAIAAAFTSPSALLKHELAYCLGQSANLAAVAPLQKVLADLQEDPMCRHEAAEALGALGDAGNLDILRKFRDREGEDVVIKETCEIAIDRIEWENSEQRKQEKLHQRYAFSTISELSFALFRLTRICLVTLPPSILRPLWPSQARLSTSWKKH